MSEPLANLNNIMAAIEKKQHLGLQLALTAKDFTPDKKRGYWYCDLAVNGFNWAGCCLDMNEQVEMLIDTINKLKEKDQS